jgi:predicted dithiol-disulfide oxidoreductase (DUF899 family)
MTTRLHDRRFPGETDAYRTARDELLSAELALRTRLDEVAARRRALPPGGVLREDYVFAELAPAGTGEPTVRRVRLSELFRGNCQSLVLYSFMFGPDWETPCRLCTAFLDGLNGNAPHLAQRIDLAVVAKAPIEAIHDWGRRRGWTHLRLLSSNGNTYNRDYFGEDEAGEQIPNLNVFRRVGDRIAHFYATELLFLRPEPGQHPRHIDLLWPLWGILDLTPEGRGTDWLPSVRYAEEP